MKQSGFKVYLFSGRREVSKIAFDLRKTIAKSRESLQTLKLTSLCPYPSYFAAINENFHRCEKLASVRRKFN